MLVLNPLVETVLEAREDVLDACDQAKRGCMPAYVFSIEGQIHFRQALRHLSGCRRRSCAMLRRTVWQSMRDKLNWLFAETVILGCVQVQPYLYGAERIVFSRNQFGATAHHLAHCPHDSCAQLRRALLLRVRNQLRPA